MLGLKLNHVSSLKGNQRHKTDQHIISRPGVPAVNTLRPRQDGRHFPDDIFKLIFFNENCCILFQISLKYVPNGPFNNNTALVQIMAWRLVGAKPLSEPMLVSLLTPSSMSKCVVKCLIHSLNTPTPAICVCYRWYDRSTKSSHQEREKDAIQNIRYYFAHIANGVSMFFVRASLTLLRPGDTYMRQCPGSPLFQIMAVLLP